MAIKVVSLADATADSEKLMMIIFGPPGCGKTVLACGSQKMRTLLLDVDKGGDAALCWDGDDAWKSGDKANGVPPTVISLVHKIRIESYAELCEAIDYAVRNCNKYDLIVLDSITLAQRYILKEACRVTKVDMAEIRTWGVILEMLESLTERFKNIPTHVLFTAHELVIEKDNVITEIKPDFQGSYKKHYSRHFSVVARYIIQDQAQRQGQTVKNVTVRGIQCKRDGKTEVKDRSNIMTFEKPFIDHIFDKFLTHMNERIQLGKAEVAVK